MRIKFLLLAMGLLGITSVSRADSLMPSLHDVANYLASNSVLPISQQADMQLARNILIAQADPQYAYYTGPESLLLSEQSVVRAISLYCCWPGSPAIISSESLEPIVWAQSRLPINPNATVTITPSSLNFGDVPVGTPEPEIWILMLLGLAGLALSSRGFARLSLLGPILAYVFNR